MSDVKIGWLLWMDNIGMGTFKSAWYPILSINVSGSRYAVKDGDGNEIWKNYIEIETRAGNHCVCENEPILAIPHKERLAEIKMEALTYQETLTKSGVVSKRKVAA